MKEYDVSIYEVIVHTARVTADDEDGAYSAAYNIITGEVDGEYDTESDGFTGRYYINEV